jgi:hypothetical protein
MDKVDPLILLEKLKPLEASKIWKSSALELKAFIYLKTEKKEQAKETFQSILDQKNTPSSLSTRARNMIEYLKEE